MLELYHSEPNTFFLKPLIALHEKQASFQSRWFNAEQLDHFALNTTRDIEAHLHLEREGPLLRHGDTVISNSFFSRSRSRGLRRVGPSILMMTGRRSARRTAR